MLPFTLYFPLKQPGRRTPKISPGLFTEGGGIYHDGELASRHTCSRRLAQLLVDGDSPASICHLLSAEDA